ncbi:MAG: Ig-like domain-containing protein, partial [Gammaproteobacteria bacterium]|nr:Ig-like domain-containing protein [Gammaproteobacteria bacterium]
MKKIMIGLTVVGSMALAGCSDKDQPLAENSVGNNVGITQTRAVYAPGDGNIPVPNDLIFAGTENLTLNPPVADPTDFSDPLVAVSSLDGWSATAPFAFSFSNLNPTIDLDPSSVVPGSTIKMYEVSTLRPEVLPGTGIVAPTGPVTNVIRELTAPNDFVATYAGPMTVAILPTRPLTQQAGYMVVVTKGVRDTNGNAVMADAQYRIAQAPDPLPVGTPVEALEPVRQLVNAMENAAEAAGQPKADIVMSFQFTVQSVGDVVATAKLVYVDMPLLMGQTPATSFTSLGIDTSALGLGLPGYADLYKGEFTLPYYLTAPDSLGNLRHPDVANPLSVLTDFIHGAANIPDGQGGSFPNPFAADVTTYANKLPQVTGTETVPLMVSLPTAAMCNKPANGYPVTIFQHGITSNRTTMVGLADTMASVCTAVIAMDLPIHGIDNTHDFAGLVFEGYTAGGVRERTFGVDYVDNATGAPGPDGNPDASGAHTMNLQYLLVARDNTRQAILDLLALEKAIPFMDVDGDAAPDFDMNNIKFVGHSLGGIVGTGFIGNSDYVESAVLANPSSGLA